MDIIIDSNILFSALIKDSYTRRLIIEYEGLFLFPEYILEEMQKHKEELIQRSGLNNEELDNLMNIILNKVSIVPNALLEKYRNEANQIIGKIDPNDVIFIACGLAFPESILWTDDKNLKKQEIVKIMNTKEITILLNCQI